LGALLILAGFVALSRLALATAVWLVPIIYALRMAWVYRAVANRLGVQHHRATRAIAGGLLLGAIATLVSLLARHWLPQWPAALLSSVVTLCVCWLGLRKWPGTLLAPELGELLRHRASDSKPLAAFCRLIGFPRT
jgi:hypothetical protein